MNVIMLGNGFDLYYKLPTKYNNFLHTVEFLLNNDISEIVNVGQVFGNRDLQEKDNFISESYEKYKSVYDRTLLDSCKLDEIKKLLKENIWYSYLLQSFNKDIGWIDFEKEISIVISNFRKFLIEFNVTISKPKTTGMGEAPYIFDFFDFYLMKSSDVKFAPVGTRRVKPNYVLEYPLGSKNEIINKEKIIQTLNKESSELSKALKIYLKLFVENVVDKLSEKKLLEVCKAITCTDYAVTFNYTNTYEKVYLSKNVFHIHGNIDNEIVLGVNPDEYDELNTIDTSFIAFKKYFQRAKYETDYEYLKWIGKIKATKTKFSLIVMGHSLDITDEDIITDLFLEAKDIVILYHNEESKMNCISNIVKIFGKDGFYDLRTDKRLTFLPLNMDFTEFEKLKLDAQFDGLFEVHTY